MITCVVKCTIPLMFLDLAIAVMALEGEEDRYCPASSGQVTGQHAKHLH